MNLPEYPSKLVGVQRMSKTIMQAHVMEWLSTSNSEEDKKMKKSNSLQDQRRIDARLFLANPPNLFVEGFGGLIKDGHVVTLAEVIKNNMGIKCNPDLILATHVTDPAYRKLGLMGETLRQAITWLVLEGNTVGIYLAEESIVRIVAQLRPNIKQGVTLFLPQTKMHRYSPILDSYGIQHSTDPIIEIE
jgi:hypothetical protein